jgi:glycosyltransferase involved in cell wall biosynthesis
MLARLRRARTALAVPAPASTPDAVDTPSRLSIVVSTPTFLPAVGGAELGIHEIFCRLATKYEVTIITPRIRGGSVDQGDYRDAPYRVRHPISSLERISPEIVVKVLHRTGLSYLAELVRMRFRGRVGVINFHYIEPHGWVLIVMRRLLGTPAVLSLVGRTDVLKLLPWPRRLYARLVMACSDAVLPNSAYYTRGVSSKRVEVIPYGVDTVMFSPHQRSADLRGQLGIQEDQPLLLSVQRLSPVKRVDVLIHVMAKIVQRDRRAVLLLVGQGEEESALRRLADELGLGDNVRFAGYVPSAQLPAYFGSADIFVFHSVLETFGIVFVQAMASGLPIVAANSSCVPDVVHDDNGTLVTPFDISGFSDAVMALINDPARRQTVGRRNRRRAEDEFDWNQIACRYQEVLVTAAGG